MGLLKEFKEFAVKGNLVDIAVGFVMGATFTKIVTSFVDGMVMPMVGMLSGGVDFSDKVFISLNEMTSNPGIKGPNLENEVGSVLNEIMVLVRP